MTHELKHIDTTDVLLAFIESPEKSEGMLVEIGYGLAKGKQFAMALKNGIKTTSIGLMANPLIPFDNIDDLCTKLKTQAF